MAGNSRRHRHHHSNFATRYRDSSLAMCLDINRDLASEAYDFAEPKVMQGVSRMKTLQLKGPQCGPSAGGRRRNSSRQMKHRRNRPSRSASSGTSGSWYANEAGHDDANTTRDMRMTYQGNSSWTVASRSLSSDTMAEGGQKLKRAMPRGRSPTRRIHSVNAATKCEKYQHGASKKRPVRLLTTLSEWQRKRSQKLSQMKYEVNWSKQAQD